MRPYAVPILMLGLVLAAPPFATAQDSQPVTPEMAWRLRVAAFKSLQAGTTVRLSLQDVGRKTGTVVTTGDSALSLTGPGRIPYAGIDSVWVRRNHAKVGAAVGSLIGGVVAIAVMSGRTCNGGFSALGDCTASRTLEVLGIMVGGRRRRRLRRARLEAALPPSLWSRYRERRAGRAGGARPRRHERVAGAGA